MPANIEAEAAAFAHKVLPGMAPRWMEAVGCPHCMNTIGREYPQLDGIFCTNDDLAVGAAFECQRLGLKIPDDMAIAGFHGHDIGQVMEPRLASVLTPRERMGSIGAERLLARIRGEAVTPKMLDLGFTLSPGGSI